MAAGFFIARRVLRRLQGGSHVASGASLFHRRHTYSTSSPPTTTTTYGTAPSHGSPAALAVAEASERIILPHVCEHLMRHGYAVIDGALDATRIAGGAGGEWDPTLSETLFRELDDLAGTPGVMVPNATHLVRKEGTVKLEKANILEAEVHALGDDILTNKAPTFRAILEDRRCGNTNATHACGGVPGKKGGGSFFFPQYI